MTWQQYQPTIHFCPVWFLAPQICFPVLWSKILWEEGHCSCSIYVCGGGCENLAILANTACTTCNTWHADILGVWFSGGIAFHAAVTIFENKEFSMQHVRAERPVQRPVGNRHFYVRTQLATEQFPWLSHTFLKVSLSIVFWQFGARNICFYLSKVCCWTYLIDVENITPETHCACICHELNQAQLLTKLNWAGSFSSLRPSTGEVKTESFQWHAEIVALVAICM